ncbi:hypothetical protein LguiB_009404 [Lonicera macranthoides]
MSQQRFASNVVEKCLTFGSPEERQMLVNEMLGTTDENEPLQAMMKDQFANYVVHKVHKGSSECFKEIYLRKAHSCTCRETCCCWRYICSFLCCFYDYSACTF